MKITNNQGIVMELDDKMIEILSIVYSTGDYKLQKGNYDEAEDFLIKNGYVLWQMFNSTLHPIPNLKPLETILSNWEDSIIGNKVLTNLFGHLEK